MPHFAVTFPVPLSAAACFAWHTRTGSFARLMPPWVRVAVEERCGGLVDGGELHLRVDGWRWTARYRDVVAGQGFIDEQVAGPFRSWVHTHRMIDSDRPGACQLDETVDWEPPGGALGRVLAGGWIARQLDRFFAFRGRRLQEDLARHATAPRPLRVAISGAGGLVGGALADFLDSGGHQVLRLVRRGAEADASNLAWDPAGGLADPERLSGTDAVVHLAGRNLAHGRWTPAVRRELVASRVDATRRLCAQLAGLATPPRTLVVASAVGIYGERGDAVVDETATAGTGFLAELCQAWESACAPARAAGIRVVHARLGVVLAARSGALATMVSVVRCGLAGRLGHGRQGLGWIALDDAIYALHRMLWDDQLSGPINLVAPTPIDQRTFISTLAAVLRRPAVLPAPAWALRLAVGAMADEVLLSGARVLPARLLAAGFRFSLPDLDAALRWELGR